MTKAKVQQLVLPPGRRLLAVSDIHANPVFFRALLKKAAFCPEDYLFILGDIVEKGDESLAMLRLLMALCRENPHIYTVCGNCDDIAFHFVDETGGISADFYDWYLTLWGNKSLLIQMGLEAGVVVRGPEDYPALRTAVREKFGPELQFLRDLPNIIETQNFLFVHGGIPREDRLEELEAWRCMKNDDFLSQGHSFQKWCVVGHWPVTLYSPSIPCARPIIERERHIISIDGGCSLNPDGQLNALVIADSLSEDFSYLSYDGLPVRPALDAQAASAHSVNIRWEKNRVEVLERGPELSRCLHGESGRTLEILSDYLYEKGGITRCHNATDYQLPVSPGDALSVVRETTLGTLVKKDGVTGWYFGRLGTAQ